jgi:hypothetical protein
VFLRARWYDPRSGRFASKDPFPGYAGLPSTLDSYAYCFNNPINTIDPSGELPPWLARALNPDYNPRTAAAAYALAQGGIAWAGISNMPDEGTGH